MIDLDILSSHELTHDNLKRWFNEDPSERKKLPKKQQEQLKELSDHIRMRVQNGREWNISKHSVYHALDLAWDSPFRQVSPTLIASLMGQVVDEKDTSGAAQKLKSWGIDLGQVVQDVPDPKVTGKSIKTVNVPAFFQVFVPLVRAYVTIRWAKIINDRRLVPFFKYEPAIDTKQNRMKCDVITSRIEVMSRQIGYFEVLKQCVFQMLHYSTCLQFPLEEWYDEEQLVHPAPEKPKEGEEKKKSKATKKVVKEGVRYKTPHPTRMFWDQAHRPSTFNSDTGCDHAGYWQIVRFADVYDNDKYWNRDLIPLGTANWWDGASAFFQTVYRCTVKFPAFTQPNTKDREANLSTNLYYSGTNNRDHSVMLTEYFEKIVPKDRGLGTYEHPVWFRFVVVGDTGTVVYAAPLPYCPVIAYLYDADELREQNASLSLEVLPFQDQFSNLLTQYLLTVQHNLTNLTMVDKDQIDEKDIDKIENSWAMKWVRRTIVRFSGRKSMKAQQSTPNAAQSINFVPLDSNGIIQAMKIILDTLERVLVMSSQEVAQAASHEQTREEIRNIAGNSSSRLTFTETPVDLAVEAWKRQLYSALMAYGTGEFYAQVPYETDLDKKAIEELGFTVVDEGADEDQKKAARKVTVKVGDKTAISLESFASSRDGNDRINNVESAAAMAGMLRDVANGPYAQALGPEQFVRLMNEIARLAGFPRDFKLINKMPADATPEKQKEEQQKFVDQIVEMSVQAAEQKIAPEILKTIEKPLMDLKAGVEAALQGVQQTQQGVVESFKVDEGQTEAIKTIASAIANLQAALGISPMPQEQPQQPPPQQLPPPDPTMPPPPMG